MGNKTHNFITRYKNNHYQAFPVFEVLLIEDGEELKAKLPDELEYTKVGFSKSPQEGDLTTPCADGSIWRYENKKWNKQTKEVIEREREIDKFIKAVLFNIERNRERKREEAIKRRKGLALTALISVVLFFAGIGLIDVISFILTN